MFVYVCVFVSLVVGLSMYVCVCVWLYVFASVLSLVVHVCAGLCVVVFFMCVCLFVSVYACV